jgi:transcriptional regulator with XRE-family HTH domain
MEKQVKPSVEIDPLCRAVKAVRTAAGWSQEKMAQEILLSTMTLSRFERGVQIPRDYLVLLRLHEAAQEANCPEEAQVFQNALRDAPRGIWHTQSEMETALSQVRREKKRPRILAEYHKVLKALLHAHMVLTHEMLKDMLAGMEPLPKGAPFDTPRKTLGGWVNQSEIGRVQEQLRKELTVVEEAMKRKRR